MTAKQRRHRRLRCLGHIINLCCQAFLLGSDCEKQLAKLEKHYRSGDFAKVEELWKKYGCLGRLHNLVRYIRGSSQRRDEFASLAIGGELSEFDNLELIQSNSTRWNSWFKSLTRAINVRERLELFCLRHRPQRSTVGVKNFLLDEQNWFELEHIHTALSDYYSATLLTEGRTHSLADWFDTLDCLLREISDTKDHFDDAYEQQLTHDDGFSWNYLKACADASWAKCEEYYTNKQLNWRARYPEDLDLPPAYYAAHILDPFRKWTWLKQQWVICSDQGNGNGENKKEWFQDAQRAVKNLWEEEYKGKYSIEVSPLQAPSNRSLDPTPAFDRQREHKRIKMENPITGNDLYEQYISTDRLVGDHEGCDQAIQYWNDRYDSQRELARLALDLLAINPMSDECERLFSSAKLMMNDRRLLLKEDIMEACECLRFWLHKND